MTRRRALNGAGRVVGERSTQPIRLLALVIVLLPGLLSLPARATPEEPAIESPAPGRIEFVGRNRIATANGLFHRWRLRDARLDRDRLEEAFALVEVDLASIDTDNDRRDAHLRTADFFDVETYPVATARVHSARAIGESERGHPLYEARFDLDLHGVKKTLVGEVERVSEEPLAFEGSLTIDRRDFGIGPAPSRWSLFSIDPEIPVRFRLEAPATARP